MEWGVIMVESEILTSEEVAKLLRVSERTVCEWAQQGQIPSGKIGNVWRFPRAGIEAWLEEKLGGKGGGVVAPLRPSSIAALVRPERTLILGARSKEEVLNRMLANLGEAQGGAGSGGVGGGDVSA
jgi:nitrogen PTS system EIIA component